MLTGNNKKNRHTRAELLRRVAALVVVGTLTSACFAGLTFAEVGDNSLTVKFADDFEQDFESFDKLAVDLYQVAVGVKNSQYDTYDLTVTSDFESLKEDIANAQILDEDADPSESVNNKDEWVSISQAAAKLVRDKLNTDDTTDDIAVFNSGIVSSEISGIDAGLYLVLTHTKTADLPVGYVEYFVDEFDDVDTTIATVAVTDTYEYHFKPQLIFLPGKTKDEDGTTINQFTFNTAYDWGDWVHDATIVLKPAKTDRFGSIKVIKILDDYDSDYTATFVFDVEAVKTIKGTEQTVYSNVFTLNFNAAGDNSFTVEKIPIGSKVTVTELYSGSSYELVTADSGPKAVENSEDVVEFTFENKSGEGPGGYGILNTFVSDGTFSWIWIEDYNRDSSTPVGLEDITTGETIE